MSFKIAAQLYTLRDFLQTPEDMKKTLKRVKNMGYNAVQISGIGKVDKEKSELVKKITDELELVICATHISFEQLINEFDWVVEFHHMWECKYVGIGSMPVEYRKSFESYHDFATVMNKYGKTLSDKGLKLIYHNHRFEFEKYNGKLGMDILFEQFNPEIVQFEIDTYWIQAGGANPTEWINKVNNRMSVVHFKDMIIKDDKQLFSEIGEGNLNWKTIIEACNETDVEWAAVERDSGLKDPFDSLEISLKNLKDMGCQF